MNGFELHIQIQKLHLRVFSLFYQPEEGAGAGAAEK